MGCVDVCPYEAEQQLMVGIHAPSHLPSLHETPGPLSEPPIHLHLKEGWARRPSLCSLPHSRNDLIYLFINGNIGPPPEQPSRHTQPQQQNRRERWKERIVILRVIPDPTDRHHRAWFMCWGGVCSLLGDRCVESCWRDGGVSGAQRSSKRHLCAEVSHSHVCQSMTGCFRSH